MHTVKQVNQIGTVTEAIEVVKMARDAQWGVVTSHRCGETEDSFIADLSVGLATGVIKAGAPCRGERIMKYNQVWIFFQTNILSTPYAISQKHDKLRGVNCIDFSLSSAYI